MLYIDSFMWTWSAKYSVFKYLNHKILSFCVAFVHRHIFNQHLYGHLLFQIRQPSISKSSLMFSCSNNYKYFSTVFPHFLFLWSIVRLLVIWVSDPNWPVLHIKHINFACNHYEETITKKPFKKNCKDIGKPSAWFRGSFDLYNSLQQLYRFSPF